MAHTILTILGISVIIAVPSSMLVLSLEAGRPYLKELFGNRGMLVRYFLVMFIIIPSLAVLLLLLDSAHTAIWIPVMVIVLSPTSPGMIKGITKLGGNPNISIAWMITAIFLSFIMIPLSLLFIGQFFKVSIDLGIDDVAIKLSILFIAPLLVGFIVRNNLPNFAPILKNVLDLLSKVASIVMIICVLIISVPVIIKSDPINLLLIFVFLVISLAVAHFMELPSKKYGPILPLSVVLRVPVPALVLAGINDKTMVYAPVILSFVIIGMIVMALYKKLLFGKAK